MAQRKLQLTHNLSDRELATVLASLRWWQSHMEAWGRMPLDHEEIATNLGEIDPLNAEEIDELCERINQ
jgi:hypothetical protein